MEEKRMGLYVQVALYMILAVSGMILVKQGTLSAGIVSGKFNLNISFVSLLGIMFYGCSFLLYMVILQKFDLTDIIPITTGVIYILTFIAGIIFFKETVSIKQIIAASIILFGIILMAINTK